MTLLDTGGGPYSESQPEGYDVARSAQRGDGVEDLLEPPTTRGDDGKARG
jgi:hypothetical protein